MSNGLLSTIQSSFSALYRTVDLLIISASYLACLYGYGTELDINYQLVLLIALSSFLFISQTFDLYRSWRTSTTLNMLSFTALVWIICCTILITLAYFTKTGSYYSRVTIGLWFVVTLFALCSWRVIFRALLFHFRKSGRNTKSVIIIGVTPSGIKLADEIVSNPQLGLKLIGNY